MYTRIFIIVCCIFSLTGRVFADCELDTTVPSFLAEYQRNIKKETEDIIKKHPNICSNKSPNIVSNSRRVASITDQALSETPMMENILIDFEYNIVSAFRGETHSSVQKHGTIFEGINTLLISTLDTLGRNCQLEDNEAQQMIVDRIRTNNEYTTYFKLTTIGQSQAETEGIKGAIYRTFNPSATESCKTTSTSGDMQDDMGKKFSTLVTKLQNIGAGTDKSLVEWKQAIALMHGQSNSKTSYTDIQRGILIRELNRQGLGQRAIDQMVANFDCFKKETAGKEDPEDIGRAKAKCMGIEKLGYDKLAASLKSRIIPDAQTTQQVIQNTSTVEQKMFTDLTVKALYSSLNTAASEDVSDTDTLIGNLVNLHVTLVSINDEFEVRIPIMQKNCMKARPDIIGGCK